MPPLKDPAAGAAEAHLDDFRARILVVAEDFAAGRLSRRTLGFWFSPQDRRIARRARRETNWRSFLAAAKREDFRYLTGELAPQFADFCADLGPAHAAHVEWLWNVYARAVVGTVILWFWRASRDGDPAYPVLEPPRSILQMMAGLVLARRWVNPEPLLYELSGRDIRPLRRSLYRVYRKAVAAAWSLVGAERPQPPLSLGGGYQQVGLVAR